MKNRGTLLVCPDCNRQFGVKKIGRHLREAHDRDLAPGEAAQVAKIKKSMAEWKARRDRYPDSGDWPSKNDALNHRVPGSYGTGKHR